jgi:DNA-binding MarR family transcriptional regulator
VRWRICGAAPSVPAYKCLPARWSRSVTIRNALPLQYAQTFLAVALEPDSTINELSEATGVTPAATSRQVSDLGNTNRYHRPGYGLVETRPDIMDRRFNRSRLTPAGHAMVGKVLRAMAA